jgi:hypothetical protein
MEIVNKPKPRPPDEGEADGFPYETWHYDHLDGIGEEVKVEFVDTCLCGNYKIASNILDRDPAK